MNRKDCCLFLHNTGSPAPVKEFSISGISSDTISLSWMFGFNGNSEITSVTLSYTTVANFRTTVSESVTLPEGGSGSVSNAATITGLEPHTQYSFSIRVTNAVGTGEPVIIEQWTLPLSKCLQDAMHIFISVYFILGPGAPINVNVVPGASLSLVVSWIVSIVSKAD